MDVLEKIVYVSLKVIGFICLTIVVVLIVASFWKGFYLVFEAFMYFVLSQIFLSTANENLEKCQNDK